jgi:NAD(P)-dependent dehydrogenase (short-subunit alcohol dehydrogenase family)
MNSKGRLAGKVAVVTGAGSKEGIGTGAAMAIKFAQEGCRVVVLNRSEASGAATVDAIHREGGESMMVVADVSRPDDCRRAAQEVVAAYDGVDVLVNNAAQSSPDTIVDGPDETWDAVMGVKLRGTVQMTRSLVSHIRRGGSIINISSISALRTPPNRLAYSTANGAIFTLTRVMAVQIGGRGIRVNCIVPGQVWTPMARRALAPDGAESVVAAVREERRLNSPLQLEGTPWDIANTALFFASEDSRWLTGQTLVVDGGYLC